MKNAIYYFYQISSYDIHKRNKNYYFKSSQYNYALICIEASNEYVENSNELSMYLLNNGIMSNQLIYNKYNLFITRINNYNYVLMRYFVDKDKTIETSDILSHTNSLILRIDKPINWKKLWSEKIDYIEYQMLNFGKKNSIIRESFNYYIGLGENAICLLSSMTNNIYVSIQHKRIKYNDTLFELYNPLNYIIDSRVRDICEYIKSSFFNSNFKYNEDFEKFIISQQYTNDEYILFFSRLMFPTYYFDIFEQIMIDNDRKNKLKKIVSKTEDFEYFLKKTYSYLNYLTNMPDIEWLKK